MYTYDQPHWRPWHRSLRLIESHDRCAHQLTQVEADIKSQDRCARQLIPEDDADINSHPLHPSAWIQRWRLYQTYYKTLNRSLPVPTRTNGLPTNLHQLASFPSVSYVWQWQLLMCLPRSCFNQSIYSPRRICLSSLSRVTKSQTTSPLGALHLNISNQ